jgi:hypothetical protein
MRLAIIILAHKLPDQLVRLVQRLTSPGMRFFIHVDRRTDDETFSRMREPLFGRSDVSFVSRHASNWGQFGHVRGALEAINQIVRTGDDYDYVVLLSGQTYPIKPVNRIIDFLSLRRGRSFLDYNPLPRASWGGRGGMERFQFRGGSAFGRVWRFADRPSTRWLPLKTELPGGLAPYQGEAWWLLELPCIEYVHRFAYDNPRIIEAFSRLRIPDESFFQMVLLNSPLADRFCNDDLHYADWSKRQNHPEILRMYHLPALRSAPDLFARKFDATVDPGILDAIDAQLLAGS